MLFKSLHNSKSPNNSATIKRSLQMHAHRLKQHKQNMEIHRRLPARLQDMLTSKYTAAATTQTRHIKYPQQSTTPLTQQPYAGPLHGHLGPAHTLRPQRSQHAAHARHRPSPPSSRVKPGFCLGFPHAPAPLLHSPQRLPAALWLTARASPAPPTGGRRAQAASGPRAQRSDPAMPAPRGAAARHLPRPPHRPRRPPAAPRPEIFHQSSSQALP